MNKRRTLLALAALTTLGLSGLTQAQRVAEIDVHLNPT